MVTEQGHTGLPRTLQPHHSPRFELHYVAISSLVKTQDEDLLTICQPRQNPLEPQKEVFESLIFVQCSASHAHIIHPKLLCGALCEAERSISYRNRQILMVFVRRKGFQCHSKNAKYFDKCRWMIIYTSTVLGSKPCCSFMFH